MEQILYQYELDFLNADFCRNYDNLNNRISVNFYEFSKSGFAYDRNTVINNLMVLENNRSIDIHQFEAIKMSNDIYLTHYISHETEMDLYTRRTSIWIMEDGLWKLRFHQGTPCDNPQK